jgi:type IV pilus assembly protein PilB
MSLLSEPYRVPTIDPARYDIEPAVIGRVSRALCEKHTCIPVSRTGNYLIVAMADPERRASITALKAFTGLQIEPVTASDAAILAAIAKHYGA